MSFWGSLYLKVFEDNKFLKKALKFTLTWFGAGAARKREDALNAERII